MNRNAERIARVLRQNGFDGGVTGTCVAVWGCEVPGNGRYDSTQPQGVLLRGELLGEHLRSAPIVLDANEVRTAVDALDTFVSARLRHIEEKAQPQGSRSKIGAN